MTRSRLALAAASLLGALLVALTACGGSGPGGSGGSGGSGSPLGTVAHGAVDPTRDAGAVPGGYARFLTPAGRTSFSAVTLDGLSADEARTLDVDRAVQDGGRWVLLGRSTSRLGPRERALVGPESATATSLALVTGDHRVALPASWSGELAVAVPHDGTPTLEVTVAGHAQAFALNEADVASASALPHVTGPDVRVLNPEPVPCGGRLRAGPGSSDPGFPYTVRCSVTSAGTTPFTARLGWAPDPQVWTVYRVAATEDSALPVHRAAATFTLDGRPARLTRAVHGGFLVYGAGAAHRLGLEQHLTFTTPSRAETVHLVRRATVRLP